MKNFLSYVVPCFNCSKTLHSAIQSIYAQNTCIPFEVICTDDGSTDDTLRILQFYGMNYSNFYYYVHNKNYGGSTARNTCVENSRGNLIFNLDSDNVLVKGSINNILDYFINCTDTHLCSFQEVRHFTRDFKVHLTWEFDADHIYDIFDMVEVHHIPAYSGNYLYTRECYDAVDGFDETSYADNFDFGFRLSVLGYNVSILPNSYYLHRFMNTGYWAEKEKRSLNIDGIRKSLLKHFDIFVPECQLYLKYKNYIDIRERMVDGFFKFNYKFLVNRIKERKRK